jgi:hypothetical protein
MRDFNIRSEGDPVGFRARLEARFKIGDLEIDAVFDTGDEPAEAYMLIRLGEMADQPIDQVVETYEAKKAKGGGILQKAWGLSPDRKRSTT